jgi:hypothetical protein
MRTNNLFYSLCVILLAGSLVFTSCATAPETTEVVSYVTAGAEATAPEAASPTGTVMPTKLTETPTPFLQTPTTAVTIEPTEVLLSELRLMAKRLLS